MSTKLKNVISFELLRNLKKPTFWLTALLLPVMLMGYIALAGFSGYNAGSTIDLNSDTTDAKLGLYDASSYIVKNDQPIQIQNADQEIQVFQLFNSEAEGIEAVKNNDTDIFYALPEDFSETLKVKTYTKTETTSLFTSYDAPISQLLLTNAASHVAPIDFMIISGNFSIDTISFDLANEAEDPMAQLSKMIIPGLALVLFYILIVVFGNRLTTAMVEEKENRISEMILTSINPKDLITGKIISLIALGFIQLAVLILPLIALFIFGYRNDLIPSSLFIDWDPWLIISSFALLILSYFLFTGLCVTVGTLVPTAKDASSFSSVLMILVVLPLFFINNLMLTTPDTITYILSYFPPSAPIALLIRSTFGTLPTWELILGLIVIAISSFFIVKLAVYVFRRSALEFTNKISLKNLFGKPRKNWK